MKSATTSIRLPEELRAELEARAQKLHRRKNWIITEALREYLGHSDEDVLRKEAKRQSLLAASRDTDATWEDNADTTGWR